MKPIKVYHKDDGNHHQHDHNCAPDCDHEEHQHDVIQDLEDFKTDKVTLPLERTE